MSLCRNHSFSMAGPDFERGPATSGPKFGAASAPLPALSQPVINSASQALHSLLSSVGMPIIKQALLLLVEEPGPQLAR